MKDEPASIAAPALPRWALPLLLAIFAGGLLAIMPSFRAYYFGDEHFYTDSAIQMHQTGRILAPTFADGSLRFNKPVLSYWMILASFRLFGISVLSSRLPSLVAGLLILLLTRKLAARLFRSETTGWLAVLILACNLNFMTACMRATPDIFLCLFSLIALTGFSNLLLGEPRKSDAWIGYLGAGLAVASKGLLGLLLLAFVFLFAALRSDRATRLRALWRPLPMLACLALALGWFVAVYLKYGDLALQGFLHDQVGDRVSQSAGPILNNLFLYSGGLLLPFFPWSLLLAGALCLERNRLAAAWRGRLPAFVFILAWYGLLLAVFSAANTTRIRYILPAFPLLSAGAAALLVDALRLPSLARLSRRIAGGIALFALLAGALFTLAALDLEAPLFATAAAVLFLLAAGLGLALRAPAATPPPWLAPLACFVILVALHAIVRPIFTATPAYAMERVLRQTGAAHTLYPLRPETPSRNDWHREKYASQIRLLSGGRITIVRKPLEKCLAPDRTWPVLCAEQDLALYPKARKKAIPAGFIQRGDIGLAELGSVLRAADRQAAIRALYEPCYIVFPKKIKPARTPPAP
jgi:4-amino-4-deoxy-L-arabinose transferase-like glycosyltransferase